MGSGCVQKDSTSFHAITKIFDPIWVCVLISVHSGCMTNATHGNNLAGFFNGILKSGGAVHSQGWRQLFVGEFILFTDLSALADQKILV